MKNERRNWMARFSKAREKIPGAKLRLTTKPQSWLIFGLPSYIRGEAIPP
jgi:hypothetical protein